MKKLSVFLLVFSCWQECNAQDRKVNSIGITVPVIWGNSYGVYYSLGTRKEPEGKSKSAGVNVNYNRTIYKSIFGIVGIGYLNQNFKIARPFEFDNPTNLLYRTQSYSYSNIFSNYLNHHHKHHPSYQMLFFSSAGALGKKLPSQTTTDLSALFVYACNVDA